MRDFGRWFQEQKPYEPAAEVAPVLPDGLVNRGGKLMATCRACEKEYHWDVEPEDFTADMSYCGGGPSCLP